MIILDTNVVSEVLRPVPNPGVEAWLVAQNESDVYLTAISEAELGQGVGIMEPGRRRDNLADAIEKIRIYKFPNRILPFDSAAAQAYVAIFVALHKMGRPTNLFDCQIAAIARSRHATIATRNTTDFKNCGVELINPWQVSA